MSTEIRKPEYLDQLIDKASAAAGSDYKLAKLIEASPQTVSNWRHAKNTCPIADQVLMAELAGLKSEEWMARALVTKYEGTKKGDKLYLALGKTLAATGVVIASSGAAAQQIFSAVEQSAPVAYFIRCIEALSGGQFIERRAFPR